MSHSLSNNTDNLSPTLLENDQTKHHSAFSNWWQQRILSLSTSQKIAYGYGIAIGISVIGTTIGLVVGDHYHHQAGKQAEIAQKQKDLLTQLDREVLALRSHPQRLMRVFGDAIWFDFERSSFLGYVSRIKALSSELNAFISLHPRNLAVEAPELQNLAQNYITSTSDYTTWIESFWRQVNPGNLRPQEIQTAQQNLLQSMRTQTALAVEVKFERLAEDLSRIIQIAQAQQNQAEKQLESSEVLRMQILIVSMLVSILIATALAWYTSRAIAKPIEATTQIAQRVTQESRFDLQVLVTSKDEVGLLAVSLNQLITWVGKYTQELQNKNNELATALKQVKIIQKQMVVQEKLASLGNLTAGIAHEIRNPLNFINNFADLSKELTQELKTVIDQNQPKLSAEDFAYLQELLTDLEQNVTIINHHGQRAESIVSNMLLHSSGGEGKREATDINKLLAESVNLSYHGMRAKDTTFNVKIESNYDDMIGFIEIIPQDLNRVFLNIINNACYAVHQKQIQSNETFSPLLRIQTKNLDQQIEIRIYDNGGGVPSSVMEKIFNPFFTTKPPGEGTGLGLSLSHDIVVQKHQGEIKIETQEGSYTEFIIILPKTLNTLVID